MFDTHQVAEARAHGADCVLIIMASLDDGAASEIETAAELTARESPLCSGSDQIPHRSEMTRRATLGKARDEYNESALPQAADNSEACIRRQNTPGSRGSTWTIRLLSTQRVAVAPPSLPSSPARASDSLYCETAYSRSSIPIAERP
jgi:hypothetical protein